MAKRPHGDRVICKIKMGNQTFYARVKEGTQKLLGLERITGSIPDAKKARARGFKGTRSYTLLLASAHTVGGYNNCVSVELPVSGMVKLKQVYAWAYQHSQLAGIITPWGIKYAWKTAAKHSQKNALQKAIDTGTGLLGDLTGAADAVGDFIQGVEGAAGTVGGYINGVEGLAGDVITGAEALGKYLL